MSDITFDTQHSDEVFLSACMHRKLWVDPRDETGYPRCVLKNLWLTTFDPCKGCKESEC
jgi:hypothetical protein